MGPESFEYVASALRDPDTVRAMLEDYRAGLGVDAEHDREDRAAGRTIACPTLVGWSVHDDLERLYGDPTAIWRPWVTGPLEGTRIDSGHHMAEENPDQVASVIDRFVRAHL